MGDALGTFLPWHKHLVMLVSILVQVGHCVIFLVLVFIIYINVELILFFF